MRGDHEDMTFEATKAFSQYGFITVVVEESKQQRAEESKDRVGT